jgi:hypothetical protein
MSCSGHHGSNGCFMFKQEKSFWGLCLSCERIQNRLFLEEAQRAIREDRMEFQFHGKPYSLQDPNLTERFLGRFRFVSSSQDPRLTLLMLCYAKHPQIFKRLVRTFIADTSFITSAHLLYRKHLPSCTACGVLHHIQAMSRQSFMDLPSCPTCMSRSLCGKESKAITQRHIDHILSIFRNRVLSQHPTWFLSIFRLLQTIWEQGLEDRISFRVLDDILLHQNPIEFQIEFRDWMGAFVETPIVIEKMLRGKISQENREFLQVWTGQQVNMPFIKRIQRGRMAAWKEDLIIKTWHPSRLLTWCLDLEELKDFDPTQ